MGVRVFNTDENLSDMTQAKNVLYKVALHQVC